MSVCGRLVRRAGARLPCLLPQGHGGLHVAQTIKAESDKRAEESGVRRVRLAELGKVDGQGQCARCLTWTTVEGHERARGSRRDHTRPDMLLCGECNRWAAREPRVACWTGWAVSPKHPHDPSLQNGQALDLYGCIVTFDQPATEAEDVA